MRIYFYFLAIMTLFLVTNWAKGSPYSYQRDIYPVMIRNCAGCHNVNTPGRNWLSESEALAKKDLIYKRVFIEGSMPVLFRFFGGEDKTTLKNWLTLPTIRDN